METLYFFKLLGNSTRQPKPTLRIEVVGPKVLTDKAGLLFLSMTGFRAIHSGSGSIIREVLYLSIFFLLN
jgi:hypothetical protein